MPPTVWNDLRQVAGLALRRHRSEEDYRRMQRRIADRSSRELRVRGVDVNESFMLEVAAGPGGYSEVFANVARRFVALDSHLNRVFATQLAEIPFVAADVQQLPFPSKTFDLIYCASLLEHLPERSRLYAETRRVLQPGGRALFSFPPFWSLTLVGGHQFKPWHLLGIGEWEKANLHPLTTSQVEAELVGAGWQLVDRWARMWPANTLKLPWLLADWLTWHACYLVQ